MKIKEKICLVLIILMCFLLSCTTPKNEEKKEDNYPVSITKCQLDKTEFNNLDDISITGTMIILYYYDQEIQYPISDDNITLPNEIVEGNNTITITYQEGNYTLVRDVTIVYKKEKEIDLKDEIEKQIRKLYENKEITENISFIEEYMNIDIFFESNDVKILNNGGIYTAPVLDEAITIDFFYYIDNIDYTITVDMIAKGYGDLIEASFVHLNNIVPAKINKNISLPTYIEEYKTTVKWYYNNNECINGVFEFEKKENDYDVDLVCTVSDGISSRDKTYKIECLVLTNLEKVNKVISEQIEYFKQNEVNGNINLPTNESTYNCRLKWISYSQNILTSKGEFTQPFEDTNIQVLLIVYLEKESNSKILNIKIQGVKYMDMWQKIEEFLNRINKETIQTQSFNLYGCEEGYETVKTRNIGYLPFYLNEEVKVTEHILPDDSPLKANTPRLSTNYITLHNTGMAHPSATAKGLDDYIHTTTRVASWHFSVDDKEAYQELKLGEVGWHAGDGSTVYGQTWTKNGVLCLGGGNRNSIGIEMCVYSGCDFNWVMRNTAKIVSQLLVKYNLTPACVRQHYDFSGKNCPQVIRQANRWAEMLDLINLEYFARTELNGVVFNWKSLVPEIIDDRGTVIKNDSEENTKIEYEVSVTYNNVTKVYKYNSTLLKATK